MQPFIICCKEDYTLSCCLQDTDGNTLLTIKPYIRRCERTEPALPLSYLVAEKLTLDKLMEILKDEEEEEPAPIPEWT